MISQYHRPNSIEQALQLLERKTPKTVPLGGGTRLSQYRGDPIEVVDTQNLRLDQMSAEVDFWVIGSGARLADLEGWHEFPEEIRYALNREGTINLRQSATVGGTVVSAAASSLFTCALLAVDSVMVWYPGEINLSYGDWLSLKKNGLLLKEIKVPVGVSLKIDSVERSPMDAAFLSLAVARWKSGRVRVVLGGSIPSPTLVADGSGVEGVEEGLRSLARQHADHWAGADFRSDTIVTLYRRIIAGA